MTTTLTVGDIACAGHPARFGQERPFSALA